MDQKFNRKESRLLIALRTRKNHDGFFEIIMADYKIEKNNLSSFLENFNDDNVVKCISEIWKDEKSVTSFRKKMRALAQKSIQIKAFCGVASDDFIKNVASIANTKLLKSMMRDEASKKVNILYFFAKIENSFDKESKVKEKILKEYTRCAKKTSVYIIRLLLDSASTTVTMTEDMSDLMLKELKKSF